MRILVIGKNGQLGKSINKIVTLANGGCHDFIFADKNVLNLGNKGDINYYFDNNSRFDVIVNCAAYTGVDSAEQEMVEANQINNLAVRQIAKIAKSHQTRLIHVSTDFVFDGKSSQPYTEVDTPNPINVYGRSKFAGEESLREVMLKGAIIIRTSWLYSEYNRNFVKTILKLGREKSELSVVKDQIGSPTYATDLAEVILGLIDNEKFKREERETEIYHYSNEGGISWYEFSKEILKIANVVCIVKPIESAKYETPAKRPKNAIMDNQKIISDANIKILYWKDSLKRCLLLLE